MNRTINDAKQVNFHSEASFLLFFIFFNSQFIAEGLISNPHSVVLNVLNFDLIFQEKDK